MSLGGHHKAKAQARGLIARLVSGAAAPRRPAVDVAAIVENLTFMFNTRLGDSLSAPEYGVEDLSDLSNVFPEAQEIWRASIQATIERYEPRLTQVRVRHKATDVARVVSFEISARLAFDDQRRALTLQTQVDTAGRFEIW